MQYRTVKNYMSTAYLGPRTLDKLIFSFLILRQAPAIYSNPNPNNAEE